MADNTNTNSNNNNNNHNHNDRKRPVEESSTTTTTTSATTTSMLAATPSPAKKPMWGLRQLSWKICKIVKERGVTSYAQVADELCSSDISPTDVNVRRRVYDALNVLTGLDIIQKNPHTRTIQWRGYQVMMGGGGGGNNPHLDDGTTTMVELRQYLDQCRYRLHEQHQQLQELLTQAFCYRNLILLHHHVHPRQTTATDRMGSSCFRWNDGDPASRPVLTTTTTTARKIPLPCLLVRTPPDCIVRCNMSPDRTFVHFRFSTPFEISDDTTILQQLGLHQTSWNEIQKILPSDMIQYCVDHSLLKGLVVDEV